MVCGPATTASDAACCSVADLGQFVDLALTRSERGEENLLAGISRFVWWQCLRGKLDSYDSIISSSQLA